MQIPSALVWSLLLAGADAKLRALRRDSGLCSMEIVATVTRTYTITTSEEVVLPCKTGSDGSGPAHTADGPSVSTTSSSSPESPGSPSTPGKGKGKENIDSNLPFDSLIPSDYFPDVTIVEPAVAVTSTSSASSSSLSSDRLSGDDSTTTITTAIKPIEPSSVENIESSSPEETESASPGKTVSSKAISPEESQTSEQSAPKETKGSDETKTDEPKQTDGAEEPEESQTIEEPKKTEEPKTPEETKEPEDEGKDGDSDVSGPEPSDEKPSTPAEPTPTPIQSPSEEPAKATTTEAASSTVVEDEEPAKTTTSAAESSTVVAKPEPSQFARNYPADAVDKLQDESMDKLREHLKRNGSPGCTLENAAVRREWGDLSVAERKEYVKAVQCLKNKPAKTPSNVASGAKSRYDDFIVTHVQQTNTIHNTANFLAWHRYFTWAYETALRDECGYTGYQPYWNWDRYANDPVNSPIFDGGEGSLGGNSNGNGCADPGPFGELTVNLGPGNNLRHNPRCIKRDVSRRFAQQCTADRTMAVLNERDIGRFQDHMQYANGIHAGGHFTIGGDPGGDVFTSPGDPVFYLHHAMIDRVWWIWQLQDLDTRLAAVTGRVGGGSNRQGTLRDEISLGFAAESTILGELMSTMGGKGGDFCYIYV